jgi:hypothetical protein
MKNNERKSDKFKSGLDLSFLSIKVLPAIVVRHLTCIRPALTQRIVGGI